MSEINLAVVRSPLQSPGLEVNRTGLIAHLPYAVSLKRLLIRSRFAVRPDRDGVGTFRETGTIFIRIPKNATSSLCGLLYSNFPTSKWNGHQSAEFYQFAAPKVFTKALVCASLRDPRERFYSAFNYYKHTTTVPEERRLMDEELSFIQTIDDFFSYLKSQPNLNATKIMRWHHFRQQVDFITDAKGRVIVDLLFPIEDPDAAISVLRQHSGFEGKLEHKNVSKGERRGEWPNFLAQHYHEDQSLWEMSIKERLIYPTDKASQLNLLI